MAVCRLGTTVVGLRGTIGGITYSWNKSGPTAKVFSRPPKSAAPYQQLCRGNMARWGAIWRALTPGEKGDWDLFAKSPPETDYDKFGIPVLRSGFQWLCRLNQRRILLPFGPLSLAPVATVQVIPIITAFTCQTPSGSPGTTFYEHSDTEFGATDLAYAFVSLTPSVGVQQVRRGYQLVGIDLPVGQTVTDNTGLMITKYTWWPPGWNATLRVYRQNFDGIRSVPAVVVTTVIG